jgi:molybdopterin converting factor small subunit
LEFWDLKIVWNLVLGIWDFPDCFPQRGDEVLKEMSSPKVKLEFWMADRLGFDHPGPVILEEPLEDGESLRHLLTRLAPRFDHFSENLFDPGTQSLSSEVSLIINNHVDLPQGMDTKLRDGDRVLFLPILAGG